MFLIKETYKSSHVVFMGRILVTISYLFYGLTPETEKYGNDKALLGIWLS